MADLIRANIQGTMPNGEVWSVNPCFRLNASPPVGGAELAAAAAAIEGLTVPNQLLALQSTSTRITGIRLEARDHDGTLEAWADRTFGTGIVGGGAVSHPFQTSAVFSLRTPGPAASGRGRVYWPATGAAMDSSSLRLSSSMISAAVTGFRTYMTGIEGAITTNVDESILAVWSRKLLTTFGVTSVQAGDVADVQRRRRDAVPETYTTLSYPSWGLLEPPSARYGVSQALGGPEGLETVVVEAVTASDTPSGRATIQPEDGGSFAVQFDYDDGNGLWVANARFP